MRYRVIRRHPERSCGSAVHTVGILPPPHSLASHHSTPLRPVTGDNDKVYTSGMPVVLVACVSTRMTGSGNMTNVWCGLETKSDQSSRSLAKAFLTQNKTDYRTIFQAPKLIRWDVKVLNTLQLCAGGDRRRPVVHAKIDRIRRGGAETHELPNVNSLSTSEREHGSFPIANFVIESVGKAFRAEDRFIRALLICPGR